jgi:hypothetical protein
MQTVSALFQVRYGHSLEMNRMVGASRPDGVNFVGRAKTNNGVTGRVLVPSGVTPGKSGELTVALGGVGGVLYTFLQPESFVCGRDVAILTARDPNMSVSEKLWWCQCILANRYRYGFGRQANRTLASIVLPDEIPAYVTNSSLADLSSAALPTGPPQVLPPIEMWQAWTLDEIFRIYKGSRLIERARIPGTVPYIGASAANNGIIDYIQGPAEFEASSITVPYNGSVACAFLQRAPFCASDDVHVLRPRFEVPTASLIFVCAVLRRERYRYSYGRKWHLARMRDSEIKLPSVNGSVDWLAMEKFIEGLPFASGASLQSLDNAGIIG